MKKILSVLLLVSLMAGVASATWYWEGDVSNAWSNADNWNDGSVSPPATVPHTTGESMYLPGGTVNADVSDQMGILMVSRGGTPTTLTLNDDDVTLTVTKSSSELVSVCYDASSSGTIDVKAGKLLVYRGTGAGEIRMSHVYDATCVSDLKLSDTGIIDVEYLNRGGKTASNATFSATGGTLVVRNKISKWGIVGDGGGFSQGGCLLEIAAYGTQDIDGSVGKLNLGSGEDMDYFMDGTSKIKFDLGDPTGAAGTDWDWIEIRGNFIIDGELQVDFGSYTPCVGDKWNVWTMYAGKEGTCGGSGSFDVLPDNIQVNWIGDDILQLEYIPEPATIALLGLGLIAIRRR